MGEDLVDSIIFVLSSTSFLPDFQIDGEDTHHQQGVRRDCAPL